MPALATTMATLTLAAPVPATPPVAPPEWAPDVRAAAAFARTRRGRVRFAVRVPGQAWGWRASEPVPAASLLKAMLLVAYVDRPGVRGRALTRADRRLLDPMVRRSGNVAATRVLGIAGRARVERLAQRARMRGFHVAHPWGLSPVRAADQARFFLRLPERLPPRHRAYGLRLLRTVVPSQRWGVARAVPRGWTLHFKGGWGSGTGAVDHQSALLVRGRQRIALSILTTAQGSHAYGQRTLLGVARRLLRAAD